MLIQEYNKITYWKKYTDSIKMNIPIQGNIKQKFILYKETNNWIKNVCHTF